MQTFDSAAPGVVPAHLRLSIAVRNVEENGWRSMLDGWAAQQVARNLAGSTVEKRRSVAIRFRAFADCYPWSWSALMVDEFFLELRALKGASHSTVLGYQNALRMFLEYLTDPAYGCGGKRSASSTLSRTTTTHSSFSSRSATSKRRQHPSTPALPLITAPASLTTRSSGWPPTSPRRRLDPCNVESSTAGGCGNSWPPAA